MRGSRARSRALALAVLVLACTPLGCGADSGPETASDDSGAINIELPGGWDVDGREADLPEVADIEVGAGSGNASLLAATDLERCEGTSFDLPCIELIASTEIAEAVGTDFATRVFTLPEVFNALSERDVLYEECDERGSSLLESASDDNPTQPLGTSYEGVVDIYTGCGAEGGSTVYEFASFATEGELYLMGLVVMPTEDDLPALRSALETLQIDVTLIPGSA